jgi:hypothetical protein
VIAKGGVAALPISSPARIARVAASKNRATHSTSIEWSLAPGAEAELDEGTA